MQHFILKSTCLTIRPIILNAEESIRVEWHKAVWPPHTLSVSQVDSIWDVGHMAKCGTRFKMKTIFPVLWIIIIKIKQSYNSLDIIMGITITVICISARWNGYVVILLKFSSVAVLEVVKVTTSIGTGDENFIKITTFPPGPVSRDVIHKQKTF